MLETVTVDLLLEKIQISYRTQKFVTVFTKPVTGQPPESYESSPHPSEQFSEIHFNIIMPYTPRSKRFYFRFSVQHFVFNSHVHI
jgi:hypothetical protein